MADLFVIFRIFIAIILPCGRDDFKSFSCMIILPKFVLRVANNPFSVKFNDGGRLLLSVLLLYLKSA